ncbi:PEP-CTERM system histidine kinase PrsK [Duganella sp. FT92W]|uniref:histidine kinase n=1 Tax=Pseudoduganella rivuli TaxID=2666085 RepID=A0A7X2LWC9_9BURK|nr:XrtA/PEP-CTERM system histidine kinase PrsK [Pseudoduganella rivuli]MRV76426.1 PEP-CTERM system histidine kinase PrsK [Pseudoduganella rivuli]
MVNVVAASYGLAALVFLVLFVLQVSVWHRRAFALALAGAALATALWSALMAWHGWNGWAPSMLSGGLDILRNAAWAYFMLLLLGYLRPGSDWRAQRGSLLLRLVAGVYGLYIGVTVLGAWLPGLIFSLGGGLLLVMVRAGVAVLGLILVEQLYRSKTPQERWGVKFACLGVGGMWIFDFYLYSDAMLFRRIDDDIWAARGFVHALTAPLLMIASARGASWSSELSVSRRVLFHSAALAGSALYLLAMSSAGYYLRFVGGDWGSVMQLAFLFGAGVLLVGILFSGTFRAWLKVFISKHFYSYNYDYREEWLRFTRLLSQDGPGLADRTIQAVAALVESHGGAVWISRDNDQFEQVAHWNCPAVPEPEPVSSSFIRFLQERQWVVDLEEYERNGEMYGDMVLPGWLRAIPRAWIVVPLTLQGRLYGFMLLLQPRSTVQLNWEVIDLLKIAGSQAASYLAQQEAVTALMLARQFESFNRMSTFVVHDLKNLVAQLSLLIPNAHKHRNNPEFQQDMLDTVTHSVQKMKLMLQKLSRNDAPERPVPLAIDQLLRQAVSLKAAFEPTPALHVEQAGLQVVADGERLERVLGHLIQNAIEATPRDGSVTITLRNDGGAVRIDITDTGQGMTDEFIRERLYKPFESTKPAGMGIGAFESREYIHELGGRLEVRSVPGHGTTFSVTLPLHAQEAQDRAA